MVTSALIVWNVFLQSNSYCVCNLPLSYIITAPDMKNGARALFGIAGTPLTLIRGSPRFTAQWIIAMIVPVETDMAQQCIMTPQDIDLTVKLDLENPRRY